MRAALKEAAKARELDEVPVGAVIVKDGIILARAHNLREKTQMASAHARNHKLQQSDCGNAG